MTASDTIINAPATANTEIDTCRYSSKPCSNPRALKKTGDLHSFCEFHRLMANRNQRRCEQKRRTKRQFEKIIKRRSVQSPGFQMLMAMEGATLPAPVETKYRRRRSSSSASPSSTTSMNTSPILVGMPSIDTRDTEAIPTRPKTLDSVAIHRDVPMETEPSLEPYAHPVALHDEDVQYLFMTVVDSSYAAPSDSDSTSLVDAMYAFSV